MNERERIFAAFLLVLALLFYVIYLVTPQAEAKTPPAALELLLVADGQIIDALIAAGATEELLGPFLRVAWCESSFRLDATNITDTEHSLGFLQVWVGWFADAGEDPAQYRRPDVVARVGLHVYAVLGRFGGKGGWACARLTGVY